MAAVHVYNEIGRLRRAVLYRPGLETRNYPDGRFNQVFTLRPSRASFDLDKALSEHAAYVNMLESEGVEILYLDQLIIEALETGAEARASFIDSFISGCGVSGCELQEAVRTHLEQAKTSTELAHIAIGGIRYGEVTGLDYEGDCLAELTGETYDSQDLLVNPLNTMWFTRDPASSIGRGVTLNHMYWPERNREVLLYKTIAAFHPDFRDTPIFFRNESSFHMEGGDILNLNRENIAVGISQRTESAAIDCLARELLWNEQSEIDSVWAVQVPDEELCIHLDTYLSCVDTDTFLADRQLLDEARVYQISRGRKQGTCRIRAIDGGVREALPTALGVDSVRLIPCGGNDPVSAEEERLNNAASVLCLKPGKVCVYAENTQTNHELERAGIELVTISITELTSGFGGPNCLCLPIQRDI